MDNRYKKITDLAIALKNLYPYATTIHDNTVRIDTNTIKPKDVKVLLESLVHSLTIINKLYRQQDAEGNYISQKEDYATALMLVSPLFASKTINAGHNIMEYYHILLDEIGFSAEFNWHDLQRLTGKAKSSCNRILKGLLELNLIRKCGRGYRQFYQYELVPQTETDETVHVWESAFEEFKDFKGFEEF